MTEAVRGLTGGLSTDPKDLDEKDDTTDEISAGELFWDKLILFLATLIAALTAVDILTELLRGGTAAVCFVPAELNASESDETFIQNFCSRSVPDTQYLPIFVLIHGVLIGAVHYIWKSSFSSRFHYFFSLAKTLTHVKDEKTGLFPPHNANTVRRLQVEFSAYNRRVVYTWYQIKLVIQTIVVVVSLLVSFVVFDNFDVEFECPSRDLNSSIWPYPGETVDCIFASLRLFWLVRLVDVTLLLLIIICLAWGLLWSVWRHPDELSAKDAALFSFTTGLDSSYYVPKSALQNISDFKFSEIRSRFFVPRISTDLDFFRMLLYRTDSSLAHSFWEGEVEIEIGALRELDQQLLLAYDVVDKGKSDDSKVAREIANVTTGWSIPEGSMERFRTVSSSLSTQHLFIPDKIRGAILGLSLRAPSNLLAVDVCFGPYQATGFSSALIRAFDRVGSLNFDTSYQDEKDTTVPTRYSNGVYGYRCHNNVVTKTKQDMDFKDKTYDLWEEEAGEDRTIDFMVVGPISELKHVGTAKYLIDHWKLNYKEGSILVVLQPERVEGKKGSNQFYNFVPPKTVPMHGQQPGRVVRLMPEYLARLFEDYNPKVKTTSTADGELSWPVQLPLGPHVGPPPAEHDLDGDVLSLRCGTADCKFRVHCYRCFVDPNAKVKNLVKSFGKKSSGKEEGEVEEEGGDSGKGVKEIGSKMSGLGAPEGLLPKTPNVGAGVVVVEIEGGRCEEGEDGGQRRMREAKTTTFNKSERKGDDEEREEEEDESGGEKKKLV